MCAVMASTLNTAARTERSWAGSVFRLREEGGQILPQYFIASDHLRTRQIERDIPGPLIDETIRGGIIKSERSQRHKLYASDHIVVITSETVKRGATEITGITSYRHELVGPWSAVTTMQDDRLVLDDAYLFIQVRMNLETSIDRYQ
jgi:hypothetical protein